MSKPKAPAPPDYAAAATAQGTANTNSAIASNFLNQANQVGPYGSLTYSYDKANGMTLPDGTVIPRTTATTVLDPTQQHLLDQNNTMSSSLNDMAIKGIGYVDQASSTPTDPNSLPSMASGLGQTPFRSDAGQTGLSVAGAPGQQQLQTGYDFSKVGAMPDASQFAGQRDQITNAMMERLQPYIDRDRSALETKLANQGITHGTEAYNWDQNNFQHGVNDQRIAALLAGDQTQQNMFNNAMGVRQQGVGEAVQQGNMFNDAATGMFNQGLAANQFNNQAQGQQFEQNQQGLQDYNQAQEAQFQQGLAASQFQNQARAQALQEADYFKNQPLNMLNALRSGNQTTLPQFGNVSAGSNIQAAPIYAATNDGYNAALAKYKADLAASSGVLGGLASLGGAAITKFSDRALKSNIRLVGKQADGLGVYRYDIFGQTELGVMADEVALLRPDALGPMVGGYQTVNYGAL